MFEEEWLPWGGWINKSYHHRVRIQTVCTASTTRHATLITEASLSATEPATAVGVAYVTWKRSRVEVNSRFSFGGAYKRITNIENTQTTKYTTEKSMGRKRKWSYFCTFQYVKGFVCVLGTLHDRVEKKYCDVKSWVLNDLVVSTTGMTSQCLGDGLGRTTPAGTQVVLIVAVWKPHIHRNGLYCRQSG